MIRRTLEAPDTFDKEGWLQIGFCGHQPGVGETYISTGSLYLCSVAPAAARTAGDRRVLVGAAAAMDVSEGLVGRAVSDRSRAHERLLRYPARSSRRTRR